MITKMKKEETREILIICLRKLALEEGRSTLIESGTIDAYSTEIYEIKRKRNRIDW